ncbi:hypothetical protein U1Q18_005198, partial [Sarracenia purpurea var. burkii]
IFSRNKSVSSASAHASLHVPNPVAHPSALASLPVSNLSTPQSSSDVDLSGLSH